MSSKKHRDIELFIVDVFVAIQKIKQYTCDFNDEEALRYSSLHWDATIRELEIIGEALNNLLDDDDFSSLSPSYFRKIVNFRNVIIHGYFGIDSAEVWSVITIHLDVLSEDLTQIVNGKVDLIMAIETQIIDYKKLKDEYILSYLEGLKL